MKAIFLFNLMIINFENVFPAEMNFIYLDTIPFWQPNLTSHAYFT